MSDKVDLHSSKEGCFCFVVINWVEICSYFVENLHKDKLTQWPRRENHQWQHDSVAEETDKCHNPESHSQIFYIFWLFGSFLIDPVMFNLIGIVAKFDYKDDVVDQAKS